ncbi:cadherin repeat domain-containing protein [Hoeflea sp. G2-23]|uniref:Cadherin repeat domain-containing protein n=1 Tax=Hoeflea algicola TaxID=2983763 RepID=A0ABT3Z569_9HYPH|nr:cadherin repeat domain-containing protein [Hoeflea algicola]MCY0146866.1 cadherin repeat domain-containing protein [Hoeflea algicola]
MISLIDVNEFDVTWEKSKYYETAKIREDAVIGTDVDLGFVADDRDPSDTVTFALTNNDELPFAIDPKTGGVTVSKSLSGDEAASYTLEIVATSTDGSEARRRFEVPVEDVNEFEVSALIDADEAIGEVDENAGYGTKVGITAFAEDPDRSDEVTYSLTDQYGPFSIDPNTGVIAVQNPDNLDNETKPVEIVQVAAQSSDGSVSWMDFEVAINDVNEDSVRFPQDVDSAANEVEENAPAGMLVGITVFAEDTDRNDKVTYSIEENDDTPYAIDPVTGVVTTTAPIDLESSWPWGLRIVATSSDGSTNERPFEIRMIPVNEYDITPFVDTDAASDEVADRAEYASPVGITLSAADGDHDRYGTTPIRFTTVDADGNPYSGGAFGVGAEGKVFIDSAQRLAELEPGPHTIYVKATSDDGSERTEPVIITILGPDRWYDNPQGPRVEADYPTVSDVDRQACVDQDDDRSSLATYNNESNYFDCLESAVPEVSWRENPQGPRYEQDYEGLLPEGALNYCKYNDEDPTSSSYNNETAFFDCLDPYKRAEPEPDLKWRDNPQGPRFEENYINLVSQEALDYCRYEDEDPASQSYNSETAYFDCLDPYLPATTATDDNPGFEPEPELKWRDSPQGPRFEENYINLVSQEALDYCRYEDEDPASQSYNNETAYFDCLDPYLPAASLPDPAPSDDTVVDKLSAARLCAQDHDLQAEFATNTGLVTITNAAVSNIEVMRLYPGGETESIAYLEAGQSTEFTSQRRAVFVGLDSVRRVRGGRQAT